jgi:hypothetical protein
VQSSNSYEQVIEFKFEFYHKKETTHEQESVESAKKMFHHESDLHVARDSSELDMIL